MNESFRTTVDHLGHKMNCVFCLLYSSDKFTVVDVKIAGCSAPPCILKKGSTAQVEVDLITSE